MYVMFPLVHEDIFPRLPLQQIQQLPLQVFLSPPIHKPPVVIWRLLQLQVVPTQPQFDVLDGPVLPLLPQASPFQRIQQPLKQHVQPLQLRSSLGLPLLQLSLVSRPLRCWLEAQLLLGLL